MVVGGILFSPKKQNRMRRIWRSVGHQREALWVGMFDSEAQISKDPGMLHLELEICSAVALHGL